MSDNHDIISHNAATKWLMICLHPDGYGPGYGLIIPWPDHLAEPSGFVSYGSHPRSMDDFMEKVVKILYDDDENGLESYLPQIGGKYLGDLSWTRKAKVSAINGTMHYFY